MGEQPALYTTLIVEDNPTFAEQLDQYIRRVNFLKAPHICTNGVDALQRLSTSPVDILFLDLALPDMGGLDLLRTSQRLPSVIVTSAHSEQAIDCFDLDVIDFLPKPYDFNRFLRSLSRVLSRGQLAPILETKSTPSPQRDEIYFKSGRRLERFNYADILYIEAYGLYSKVHTLDGAVAVNKRISVLAKDLPQTRFIRIHKSYIINTAHLKRLESKQLWIKSMKLPIGITYQSVVQEQFETLGITAKVSKSAPIAPLYD